ncbi:hypothetical protein PG997_011730 [Apiospora hydei]|uniref:Secreted protein n=1 Tax=Apiospora hydei TaxID=1337664 RepID=A0ABR1V4Q9_9PEZI
MLNRILLIVSSLASSLASSLVSSLSGPHMSAPVDAANQPLALSKADLMKVVKEGLVQVVEEVLNRKKGGSENPIVLDSDDEAVKHSEDED